MAPRQHHRSASPYEDQIGFSRAVRVGDRVIVSGTAPIGPDGRTVPGGPLEQARRCCSVIVEALRALGAGPEHVVRTRMYLTRAEDWALVGQAHAEAFSAARPAATMVVVAGLLDPGWRVEMEAEAVIPGDQRTSMAQSS